MQRNINTTKIILKAAITLIVAVVLVVFLLPFLLFFVVLAVLAAVVYSAANRSPAPKPKGTVEILPPEDPVKPPFVKSTSDVDLEITIEKVQKSARGQTDEKDKFRDAP
jgi:Na+-transporting methylmalonyl-CoA/oxaloacetate decarboxylase gamma subunit